MARIIEDGLLVCDDCAIAIANGDYSGMSTATVSAVRAGYERLFLRGYAVIGDELGFHSHRCDCCEQGAAGNRHKMTLLS